MVGYGNGTTIYAVIPKLFSRPQVIESLNRDLVAIHYLCLKWHMRLNPKNTKLNLCWLAGLGVMP